MLPMFFANPSGINNRTLDESVEFIGETSFTSAWTACEIFENVALRLVRHFCMEQPTFKIRVNRDNCLRVRLPARKFALTEHNDASRQIDAIPTQIAHILKSCAGCVAK